MQAIATKSRDAINLQMLKQISKGDGRIKPVAAMLLSKQHPRAPKLCQWD
jgi:hypothetical protein